MSTLVCRLPLGDAITVGRAVPGDGGSATWRRPTASPHGVPLSVLSVAGGLVVTWLGVVWRPAQLQRQEGAR